ncbi:6642_t:CDS:2, partial [Racocetra fulgida]
MDHYLDDNNNDGNNAVIGEYLMGMVAMWWETRRNTRPHIDHWKDDFHPDISFVHQFLSYLPQPANGLIQPSTSNFTEDPMNKLTTLMEELVILVKNSNNKPKETYNG